MLTFSHPPCKESAAGLSQTQGHVLSLECHEVSFVGKAQENLKSELQVGSHACLGSLWVPFLILLISSTQRYDKETSLGEGLELGQLCCRHKNKIPWCLLLLIARPGPVWLPHGHW